VLVFALQDIIQVSIPAKNAIQAAFLAPIPQAIALNVKMVCIFWDKAVFWSAQWVIMHRLPFNYVKPVLVTA
jgi:hypothetical protein